MKKDTNQGYYYPVCILLFVPFFPENNFKIFLKNSQEKKLFSLSNLFFILKIDCVLNLEINNIRPIRLLTSACPKSSWTVLWILEINRYHIRLHAKLLLFGPNEEMKIEIQ